MVDFLKNIFTHRQERNQLLYILLSFFLGSFAVARLVSVLTGKSIYFRGYQIHHFYFGMLVLSIGGIIGLLSKNKRPLRFAGALMGVGIGLFADEIGLLLNCTTQSSYRNCVYQFPDYMDIIGTIVLAIILLVALVGFIEVSRNKRNNKIAGE
ncbi:MAG: hypothetical protein A3A33_02230 [Candidatus Yanofskybacteria bacterium RIFCSPLOWO2_01_FULL_49_25]|uniref:Uncharacterized protein n=1 Tax=Candidatus Yanofskybacteria bacterium RIFCSPLOWO2_01_FULL_49_25 TaxID=1802701 RepID=A0A1F8GUN7_9BACT|nr:MAG: hypothetical protein A3A33_02230 [Candidatus Yanofskybacteria bacterium RIFCSPLOWO2_01_FULL_49_25]